MKNAVVNSQDRIITFKPIKRILVLLFILSVLMMTACADDDDDDDDNNSPSFVALTLPSVSTETAVYVVESRGGNGGTDVNGSGGQGADISINLYNGGEGRLEILNNGRANPTFNLSTYSAATGSQSVTISSDTTVEVLTVKPVESTLYMVMGDLNLYQASTSAVLADSSEIVTGLSITDGAVLTFGLNTDSGQTAEVVFSDDILNNGQITVANVIPDAPATEFRGDLSLWVNNYVGSGQLVNTGLNTDAIDGGDINLLTDGHIYNTGNIDTSGFSVTGITGGNAGNGGAIGLYSTGNFENSGTIISSGGSANGAGSNGGNAGNIVMAATYGHMFNQGAMSSIGGAGEAIGGDGADVVVSVVRVGDFLNSGIIKSNGGAGGTDDGGRSGDIKLSVTGGKFINNADLSANGGAAADGFTGGDGGSITINSSWGRSLLSMPGNIILSGNLTSMGGDAIGAGAGTGGDAGSIKIFGNTNLGDFPKALHTQLLGLWGYRQLSSNGGSGATGNNAGAISVVSIAGDLNDDANQWGWVASADIINEATLQSQGGSVTAVSTTITDIFPGGRGGNVTLSVIATNIFETATVINRGSIDTMSGDELRSTFKLFSGRVTLEAPGGVVNSGSIVTSGSDDASIANAGATTSISAAYGNHAGDIDMNASNGSVSNSGSLTANGGSGEVSGGDGASEITLIGLSVSNSGVISANGGDASEAKLTDSVGGDGGKIFIIAKKSGVTTGEAQISFLSGVGQIKGEPGHLLVLDDI